MSTTIHTAQRSLFEPTAGLPDGLAYEPAFVERDEERELIEVIAALPLHEARYKEYTARRRVYAFGSTFDFDAYQLKAAADRRAAGSVASVCANALRHGRASRPTTSFT